MKILPNNRYYISLKQLHDRWKGNNDINDWNNIWFIVYMYSSHFNENEIDNMTVYNFDNSIRFNITLDKLMVISTKELWKMMYENISS